MPDTSMHIEEIRELAKRFSAESLDKCMQKVIHGQANECFNDGEVEDVMNVLAKAEFVKSQVNKGMSLSQAIRELGRRIRAAQGSGE